MSSKLVTSSRLRYPEANRNDEIECDQHRSLHVVRLSILDQQVDENDRDEETDRFEVTEEEL